MAAHGQNFNACARIVKKNSLYLSGAKEYYSAP